MQRTSSVHSHTGLAADQLMKKFLPVVSLIILSLPLSAKAWWGKYPSKVEAQTACRDWAKRGGAFTYDNIHPDMMPSDEVWKMLDKETRDEYLKPYLGVASDRRYCKSEKETRQFLGYQGGSKGAHYTSRENIPQAKIIKRFRY